MSVAEIRQALSDAVESVEISQPVRCTPYLTDQVNPPQGMIGRGQITYDLTMGRGADAYAFTIKVFLGRVSERTSQTLLDELVEPDAMKATIEGDTALGALVDYARVVDASEMTVTTVGTVDYLTVDFDVEVVL